MLIVNDFESIICNLRRKVAYRASVQATFQGQYLKDLSPTGGENLIACSLFIFSSLFERPFPDRGRKLAVQYVFVKVLRI